MPRRIYATNPDQEPWQGTTVLAILPDPGPRGRGRPRRRRYALILGWPTPVSELARTQMPPMPGRPAYGRAARHWAKRQLERNKARSRTARRRPVIRPWIGAYSLRWLRGVAAGRQPLGYAEYASLCRYWGIEGFAPERAVPAARPVPQLRWRVPA